MLNNLEKINYTSILYHASNVADGAGTIMPLCNYNIIILFSARCYAERGITAARRPSVCLSDCLWRWGIVVT